MARRQRRQSIASAPTVNTEPGNHLPSAQAQAHPAGAVIERFIEPCLLLLLQRESRHGYALLAALREEGWLEGMTGVADIGYIYRALRQLERDQLVSSAWSNAGGSKRRVYTITSAGVGRLDSWVAELKTAGRHIGALLLSYLQLQRHNTQNAQRSLAAPLPPLQPLVGAELLPPQETTK